MRFLDPWYGLLAIPAAALLILSFRRIHGMVRLRKGIVVFVRSALLACLIVALMGPQMVRPNRGLTTVFVIDRSDSITEADRKASLEFVNEAISRMGEHDRAAVIAFGKNPVVEFAPGGRRTVSRLSSSVQATSSNLAAALRLAMASFPSGMARRIVLLSDGNETDGDAIEAVAAIAAEGVAVDVVPLGQKLTQPEASIVDLQVPSEQAADQTFEIRAVIESSVAQQGDLIIERNGEPIASVRVSLPKGTSSVVVDQKVSEPGFFRYRAYLKVPYDSDNRNNLGAGFVSVRGKPRILLVQGHPERRELANALLAQGLNVDIGFAGNLPTRPEDLQPYDAVIFNDFNAALTSNAQMAMVRNAIRDSGIGFAMIGGEDSFLPGGYYGTPIAEALPVDLNIRQRKVFPSTSVLIVVDTSGSMMMQVQGKTKLQIAANAAMLTVDLLSPMDRLSVAGSGDRWDLVVPPQTLENPSAVKEKASRLAPQGGGIYAEESFVEAEKLLNSEPSKVRHLLFLADGADCDNHGAFLAIVSRMKANKITTSTVAIGSGKDVEFLRQCAAVGGGRFYLVEDASKLPQIFTQDVSLMSRSAIEEGAFIPKVAPGEEAARGIRGFPALKAYCLTDARPLARVGMRTHKDDPLLATWQYGLGKSMAFTSDAQNRWASEWVGWNGFGKFWAQAIRSLNRQSALNNYDLEVVPQGGKGEIRVQATDRIGTPLSQSSIEVRISDPQGNSQQATLTQEAPGRFTGSFDATEVGSYIVSIAEPGQSGESRVAARGFSLPYPPEYRSSRANLPLLQGLAEQSGGIELKDPGQAMRPIKLAGASISDIWQTFLWLALVLLPVDVLLRRVMIPLPSFGRKNRQQSQEKPSTRVEKGSGSRPRPSKPKKRSSGEEEVSSAASDLLAARRKRQNSGRVEPPE